MIDVNFYAIIVAIIVTMMLGFLWYSPSVFGAIWKKEMNMKEDEVTNKSAMVAHLVSIVTSFVSFWGLAILLSFLPTYELSLKVTVGFLIGLCFVVTTAIGSDAYEPNKSLKLSLINNGYKLLEFIIAAYVIGVMV